MSKTDSYYAIACTILVATGLVLRLLNTGSPVPLKGPLERVAGEIGVYARATSLSLVEVPEQTTADETLQRTYSDGKKGWPIHVFVGYWNKQDEQKRIKSPRYVPEGWGYYWMRERQLPIAPRESAEFKEFLNESGQKKELVYYAYLVNGKVIAGDLRLRVANVANTLLHRRNNAAVLKVTMPYTDAIPLEAAENYLEGFLQGFLQELRLVLPE